jgi:hypothetical protein
MIGCSDSLRRHYPDQVLRVEDNGPPLSLAYPSSPFNCSGEKIPELSKFVKRKFAEFVKFGWLFLALLSDYRNCGNTSYRAGRASNFLIKTVHE